MIWMYWLFKCRMWLWKPWLWPKQVIITNPWQLEVRFRLIWVWLWNWWKLNMFLPTLILPYFDLLSWLIVIMFSYIMWEQTERKMMFIKVIMNSWTWRWRWRKRPIVKVFWKFQYQLSFYILVNFSKSLQIKIC